MSTRCLRLVMFLSVTLMLVTPALAADESAEGTLASPPGPNDEPTLSTSIQAP